MCEMHDHVRSSVAAVRYNTSLNLRITCSLVSALEINHTVRNGRSIWLHAIAMPDAAAWFAVMCLVPQQ